ncbi:tetratricopeptide repeat protein [Leptospira ellisii]|uniref:Tetratricopeptide repeat protein n=1 Tax=Leptospira ellisii TaxID=2023197 RepID=A0AAE4QJY4_9LEPT|nr:tetratricopeptide repeat protein [Leptospira ellisii]MDV6234462.1 tetratricopeptide repeat protein [Leptospira ellisii]
MKRNTAKLCLLLLSILILSNCSKRKESELLNDAEKQNAYGIGALQLGDYEKAEEYFKEAHRLNPKEPNYANNVGVTLIPRNRFEQAIVYFSKAVEIDPNFQRGYFNLGVAYQNLQKNAEALRYYEKAVSIPGTMPEIYFNLGIINTRLNKKAEAKKNYETFIKEAPPQFGQQIKDAYTKIKELGV